MSAGSVLLLVAFVGVVSAAVWALARAFAAAHALAGPRVVTCPETGRPATVHFDRLYAGLTALIQSKPELELTDCSRWRERGPCTQPCAPDAAAPNAAASEIVARWSQGKHCQMCGGSLLEAPFTGRHVALLDDQGGTSEWVDIPPEALVDLLPRRYPVCWNCHVAADFRHKRPDLVTDRDSHGKA